MGKNGYLVTEIQKLIGTLFLSLVIVSCTNSIVPIDETPYLVMKVPRFNLNPNDTVVYQISENVKSILPDEYEYLVQAKFQLVCRGDSLVRSFDFNYLSLNWTWINNGDTIKFGTGNNSALVRLDSLTNNVLNIKHDYFIMDASNWKEFYANIAPEISEVQNKPLETKEALYVFYNTMFNSNWIRAKVRQIVMFGPGDRMSNFYKFVPGGKWSFNLPIEHEAKTLHPVTNTCIIDSINLDEVFASVTGSLYGQPTLVEPECITGSMSIDRHKKVLRSLDLTQHMKCTEIPSLNSKKYLDRALNDTYDNYGVGPLKFDRILKMELHLID